MLLFQKALFEALQWIKHPLLLSSPQPFHILISLADLATILDESEMPTFADSLPNITVAVGREASLNCIVSKLGNHKVSYGHRDRLTRLSSSMFSLSLSLVYDL